MLPEAIFTKPEDYNFVHLCTSLGEKFLYRWRWLCSDYINAIIFDV